MSESVDTQKIKFANLEIHAFINLQFRASLTLRVRRFSKSRMLQCKKKQICSRVVF